MKNRILEKISKYSNIAIVGFGKEGKSTYKFIRSGLKDIKLTIIDKFNAYEMMEELKDDQNIDVIYGDNYLNDLEFTDTEDIFEKISILFLDTPSVFKNKIDNLIKELGHDYVDIVENDLLILE